MFLKKRFLSFKLNKNTLQLLLPEKAEFHYQWLRDNCRCSACIHPSTQQKLHSSGQILNKKPIDVQVSDKEIEIKWSNHSSIFTIDFLKRFNYYKPFKPLIQPILWNAKEYTENRVTIDYNEFVTPTGYTSVLKQIRDYGLCFLKNVPKNETQVELVAKQFGVIKDTFYGTSWNVKNDPNSKNIAYTSLFLGLHMDLMYFEAPPGLQLLHCLENTVQGGTSLFLDLFQVVEKLKREYPREYEILCRVPVRFSYENDGKYYEYLRPTIVPEINDQVHVFYSPPFQGPLHCDPKDMNDFYTAFGIFESLIHDESLLYKYLLQEGDVVLFANRRVLHGRDSFDHASGNRWLKGTYVGWDEVKDRIRVYLK